jgi:hypothetical protein
MIHYDLFVSFIGEDIPDAIYKLKSLTTLYLRFNRIRNVSEEIRNLEKVCRDKSIRAQLKIIFIPLKIPAYNAQLA